MLDLPVVPEIKRITPPATRSEFEQDTLSLVNSRGTFDPHDVHTGMPATIEGIVSRNAAGYAVSDFANNVFKYVRKGHVKTDQHWTRHWRRARLNNEGGSYVAAQ
jgi:hypothetical protein